MPALLCLSLLPGVAGVAQAQQQNPDLNIGAPSPSSANEGDSGARDYIFPVSLTQAVANDVKYVVIFSNGGGENHAVKGDDFQVIKGGALREGGKARTVHGVIKAGQTQPAASERIGIRVRGDTRKEADEKVTVRINLREAVISCSVGRTHNTCLNPDYTNRSIMKDRVIVGTGTATFTIRNDDQSRVIVRPPPKPIYHHHIYVHSDSGLEGPGSLPGTGAPIPARREIKVQLVKNPAYASTIQGPVTFRFCNWNHNSGTATRDHVGVAWRSGQDYRLFGGNVIMNGQCRVNVTIGSDGFSDQKFEIEVRQDADVEPDETVNFTVELVNPEHAKTIKIHPGTYTIKNDDLEVRDPEVTLEPGDAVNEGGFARFGVRIANPPGTISPSPVMRRINVAARVPWTNEVWENTIITSASGSPASDKVFFDVPAYGVTGDYHLCAWVRPGRYYTAGGTSGRAPPTTTDSRPTLTDSNGNPVHNPAYGTRFNVNDGTASSCPSGHTVLVRDTGTDFQMGMDQSRAEQVPSTPVANLRVAAVDANTAKATWDAVPHATGYRVEFESTSVLADQANYVQHASNGHTGTDYSFTHNAAEAMTLTVTVTPEFREDGSVQQFNDLAGTATIEVGSAGIGDSDGDGGADTQTNNPPPASCVSDAQWDQVAGYYDANANKSPNYGANWYRVLIAYRLARPEKALPAWEGATARPTAAFTAEEAEEGEEVWSGWTPVREVLDCLEAGSAPAPEPDPPPPPPEPELSLSAGSAVDEGSGASFTVHADSAPGADVTVNVSVAQSGDYLDAPGAGTRTVTLAAGATTASLTVATVNDSVDEADGSVSVSLDSGAGYTVASSPNDAASVAVRDDDDPPPVVEPQLPDYSGLKATVRGYADETQHGQAHVNRWKRALAGLGDQDAIAEGHTPMTAAGAQDMADAYSASRWDPIVEALTELESRETAEPEPEPDPVPDPIPELSLSAGGAVDEGTGASFTLHADSAPASDVTVSVSVAQSGDYLDAPGAGTRTITLAAGATTASLTVATVNDGADEADGSVSVSLDAGAGYTVASSNAAATVAVRDDDDPPPAPSSSCVSGSQWKRVLGYYESNAGKAPNYGANWYRVLIAYRSEHTHRALPDWTGPTAAPTAAYTADEAEDGEASWSGWTPVREALECLERANGGTSTSSVIGGITPTGQSGEVGATNPQTATGSNRWNPQTAPGGFGPDAMPGFAAGSCVSPQLRSEAVARANETWHGPAHVERWLRVAQTFSGGANDATVVTPAEASFHAAAGQPGWLPVADALSCMERQSLREALAR